MGLSLRASLASFSLLLLTLTPGCKPGTSTTLSSSSQKIKVTTTTTMITDLVKQVGGDKVVVQGLMGPGVDPHLYKAEAGDVAKLNDADVIFYNGLLLEGKLQDIFGKLARSKKFVYALSEAIPPELLLEPPAMAGHYDPHIWFDVTLWQRCVDTVLKGLSEYAPAHKDFFSQRAEQTRAAMAALHQWAEKKAGELPKEKRRVGGRIVWVKKQF